jgi:hypothetical protein
MEYFVRKVSEWNSLQAQIRQTTHSEWVATAQSNEYFTHNQHRLNTLEKTGGGGTPTEETAF